MTIDKTIELLTLYEHSASSIPRDDFLDALRVAREGLKKIQNIRILFPTLMPDLLPGECPMPDFSPSADRKELLRKRPLGRECG